MPRWTFTYALVFVVGSLASAADERDGPAHTPIAAAFGITLGEPLDRDATTTSRCNRRPAPALHRCEFTPPAREVDIDSVTVFVDDDQTVLAVEARSKSYSQQDCVRLREQMLARFERLHGASIEVIFDDWGFAGAVWEQDVGHRFPVRALSLSTCAAQTGEAENHRFNIAYGAARPDPVTEVAIAPKRDEV